MTDQILLTEPEAAERLRLSTRTLRKARDAGLLRYVLFGRAVRYTVADLESYVETQTRQSAPCTPAPKTTRRSAARRSAEIISFTERAGGR